MSVLLYPPYLQWEVISDCNHKCIHCYNYWRADNIPVENCIQFEAITEKIIERKPLYVAITGGEPLLVFPKVKECIIRLTNEGITCSISTNGTLITEEIATFLEERKVDLVISLPSINKKICDEVCQSNNVVEKLERVWPILKKHGIQTNVNVVINKLNIKTLYETLEAIKKLGFVARVGMAQRPINASKEYLKYELDKSDFKYIVHECIRAKRELDLSIDFSVCMPDCAFDSPEELLELEKGDCFAGTIAYAICTNGDIKACQCDTRVYGNILVDDFKKIYQNMVEWRNGTFLPEECRECSRLSTCRGGCRVESYANKNDYKALPSFADTENIPEVEECDVVDYSNVEGFEVSQQAIFLRDLECYRVSVGIVATHLVCEFAEWLQSNRNFSFLQLKEATELDNDDLNAVLDMLIKNGIISVKS